MRAWKWMTMLGVSSVMVLLGSQLYAQAPANTPNPNHPGKAIFDENCASCHEPTAPPGERYVTFGQVTATNPAQLRATLSEGGVMAPMAAGLSADQLNTLIAYLTSGQRAAAANWTDAMMCAAENRTVNTAAPAAFGSFGVDLRSTRSLTARQAGLRKADMDDLEVAWAVGFPQTNGLGTGPVVIGDTVFVSGAGRMLALDAATGCARWVLQVSTRNTPQVADLEGSKVLVFSVGRDIRVIEAATGATVWNASGQPARGGGSIRGGVTVYKDKILVPISASGVGSGQNATFECCTGHGSVVALSLKDGARLWEYHTMEAATYNGQVSRTGVRQRGPSGAPIWSLPTIDEKRNRVIVTTGENTSHPATDTSDAIIALDLDTGREVWKYQAMAADVWNMSCNDRVLAQSGPNCPNLFLGEVVGRDFDFGAAAMIIPAGRRDLVIAGQKSGHTWALDAETGELVWSVRDGEGTTLGGVHWGTAAWNDIVISPIADSTLTPEEQSRNRAGVYAYRARDGRRLWGYRAAPDCPTERAATLVRCETKFGFSVAPIVVDGAVVAGTLDGKVMVFDARNGRLLETVDTAGPITTINGVAGRGGAIDAHAISAGAGMIFVGSGYGSFTQSPGNVLIALRPRR